MSTKKVQSASTRVILNTLALYVNMIVTVCVQLFAVRFLVKAFGTVDYGIYSIVGGVVYLFSFLNVAMAAASQRFLSYAIGQGDKQEVKETFFMSSVLHIFIGVVVLLLLEVAGVYYVNNILVAPEARIPSALILLHCITASTFVNIITVPYEADINANEDLGAIAAINILDSLMKLGTAIYLLYTPFDPLVTFGVMTMTTLIITLLIKRIYCLMKYEESHIKWHKIKDYTKIKKISSFAVWNLIGAGCGTARFQGSGMVLNKAFGIEINNAYGVAQNVNNMLMFFANSIVRAIRPQIVISAGRGDNDRVLRLSESTCRITSLMVALLAIPLYVEMNTVLKVWLGNEPAAECVMFCRAFLIIVFINQLTIGLQIAIESEGNIRRLQTIVGSMHVLALPAGALFFMLGYDAEAIMICIIVEEIIGIFMRTSIASRQTGLQGKPFICKTVLPCITGMVVCWAVCTIFTNYVMTSESLIRVVVTSMMSSILTIVIAYKLLLTESEKNAIVGFIRRFLPSRQ